MRKEIYHATVHYRWRTVRFVKGVEKPAKKWKEAGEEMKDSLWYRQTKSRCEKLANIVRDHG